MDRSKAPWLLPPSLPLLWVHIDYLSSLPCLSGHAIREPLIKPGVILKHFYLLLGEEEFTLLRMSYPQPKAFICAGSANVKKVDKD